MSISETIQTTAERLSQHKHYHEWQNDKIVEVIAAYMKSFTQEFVEEVLNVCGISRHRAMEGIGEVLTKGMIETDPSMPGYSMHYRMPRAIQENIYAKLDKDREPELAEASDSLASAISALPAGLQREFGEEALNCIRAKAYRSSVVMAWNLAIDHLITWVLTDQSRLNAFNEQWTSEWRDKANSIHNTPVCDRGEFREMKESVVIRITKKAGLSDKHEDATLQEGLRKRNQAAHPSNAITFHAPVAAGHVHGLVDFVIRHPV